MAGAPQIFDRKLLTARRERSARRGEDHPIPDFLLTRVADDFVERLGFIRRQFPLALSLSDYQGRLARRLEALPSIGRIIDAEPAFASLAPGCAWKVVADDEYLPFAAASFDLVVSGLSPAIRQRPAWNPRPDQPCSEARWPVSRRSARWRNAERTSRSLDSRRGRDDGRCVAACGPVRRCS